MLQLGLDNKRLSIQAIRNRGYWSFLPGFS